MGFECSRGQPELTGAPKPIASISGGSNDDTIIGGYGNDTLTGGPNQDTDQDTAPADHHTAIRLWSAGVVCPTFCEA